MATSRREEPTELCGLLPSSEVQRSDGGVSVAASVALWVSTERVTAREFPV